MDALKAALLKSLPPFILSSQIYDILGETPERMNDVFPSRTFEVVPLPSLSLICTC